MIEEAIQKAAVTLLLDVANGSIAAIDALGAWPDVWDQEPKLAWARHCLQHFAADQDIRAYDPAYDRIQRAELQQLAADISAAT